MSNSETLLNALGRSEVIDLSHTFFPGIPHASDMPDEETKILYDFEPDGFQAHHYCFAGQWGTHIDPPVHFVKGGRTLDKIPPEQLILPVACINCVNEAVTNPDYLITVDKIRAFENDFGQIPSGSLALMRTDWSDRWPDPEKMFNRDPDGTAHFPGWSIEAAQFLIEERSTAAFGHEPTDTDGGIKVSADDFGCETYILEKDLFQIELMANMSRLPPLGAIAFIGSPKPLNGSGFPVRVLAAVPND